MTAQQTDALQCAADLEYSIARHGMQDAFTLNAYSAMKMVRTQQARITELESQLAQRFDAADMATTAAQGFRDGVASVSAVSESVAEIGSAAGDCAAFGERALYPLVDIDRFDYGTMLYAHPSPPEGMAGWQPIETASKYTEHGIRQHLLLGYAPDEIHEDGFVSQGYWMEPEEDAPDNMGHDGGWVDVHFDFFSCGRSFGAEAYRSTGTQPTHWQPLPAAPGPADGESNG